jgi:soluble lytic murein transglycosylase
MSGMGRTIRNLFFGISAVGLIWLQYACSSAPLKSADVDVPGAIPSGAPDVPGLPDLSAAPVPSPSASPSPQVAEVPPPSHKLEPFAVLPDPERMTSIIDKSTRIDHAHELLGKYYRKSVVKTGEKVDELNRRILEWVKRGMRKKWKKKAPVVARAIIQESRKYELDPIFLLSVIETESTFNPEALGRDGEIGIMQLRPKTAKWIANKYKIAFKGPNSLKNPVTSIRIGAAYFSMLRDEFESHSRLYLAAYNMGARSVKDLLEKQVWPKEYPQRVMSKYVAYYSELSNSAARGKH